MTLTQLRYLIAIAESGSISSAANKIYASQSNLSIAMQELEREFGIKIFTRSNRGVTLTNEGSELLAHARQVVEQADMLEGRFSRNAAPRERLAVSAQHYAFSVRAFINVAASCESDEYELIMRETATHEIVSDVKSFRSDVGVLYVTDDNRRVLGKSLSDASLAFHPLFEADVHVFVGEDHPLAGRETIALDELEAYPRYSFEQGTNNSFYFSEEPLGQVPHGKNIRVSDRATYTTLLTDFDGYALSTGVLTPEMQAGIVSIPLESELVMTVGYVVHEGRVATPLMERYIDELGGVVKANPSAVTYVGE